MALHLPLIFITLQPALVIATNVLTLAIGPRHRVLQFAFSVPVLFILAAQSLYRDWDRGWGLHYGLNCFVVTSLFTWVDWILLNDPYKERWVKLEQRKGAERVEDEKVDSAEGAAFPKDDGDVVRSKSNSTHDSKPLAFSSTFWERLCWAMRLATTNRYVGWSCEVKNAPASVPPTYPRWYVAGPQSPIPHHADRAGNFWFASPAASRSSLCSRTRSTPTPPPRRTGHGWTSRPHLQWSRSQDTRTRTACTGHGSTSL